MDVTALQTRIWERLDDDSAGWYYTPAEVLNAINKAQRQFAFLTLCIERTKTFELTSGVAFYTISDDADFSDYLLPLKVTTNGVRVTPKTIHQLDALRSTWRTTAGTPTSYGTLGLYLLFTYPRVDSAGQSLSITYAAEPAVLASGGNIPEIPEEFHTALVDYAIYWLRAKEGGVEFKGSVEYLRRFLGAASKHAEFTRARCRAMQYDRTPPDLRLTDRSKLFKVALASERAAMIGNSTNGGKRQ